MAGAEPSSIAATSAIPRPITLGAIPVARAAHADRAYDACPAGSGADTILLGAGTYRVDSTLPVDQSDVSIVGAGTDATVIESNGAALVIDAYDGWLFFTVELRDLAVRGDADAGLGGCIMTNAKRLTLDHVLVSNCSGSQGAGLIAWGPRTEIILESSTIRDCNASGSEAYGGAIYALRARLNIRNSLIANNHANLGAGIYLVNEAYASIRNTTISGNKASYCAAIQVRRSDMDVRNSTIAYNGNSVGAAGGVCVSMGGSLTLLSSIVAANSPRDLSLYSSTVTTSHSYIAAPGSVVLSATDRTGSNPGLVPLLADNGGPTLTHALLPQSPAIDAGNCEGLANDQTGAARIVDHADTWFPNAADGCDMGAYELRGGWCTVLDDFNGTSGATVVCDDGSSAFLPDGEDGEEGVDGEDGEDGVDGQDGRDGVDGQDGRDGVDGLDGHDGVDGQDGRDGVDGQDGRDGVDGQDGEDGQDGLDGQNGVDGQDGEDGQDGQDGQSCTVYEDLNGTSGATIVCPDGSSVFIRDGVDGQDGEEGQDGVDGLAGQNGAAGTDGASGRDGMSTNAGPGGCAAAGGSSVLAPAGLIAVAVMRRRRWRIA